MSGTMNQSALLVLDNLEHLIGQSAEAVELVSEFLERIPSLKILATSRERLNLHGEWMYELHGLPVPPVEFADKLDEYSAAVLFMQRSEHIKPNFEVSESERLELIRICRLVEGVPLAIELAAAWVGMLTCGEIAREIEANVDFLAASMRDMPERHRSLRASFDHSWKLLSDSERDVLSRLSIFHGGFDRHAAEKVAGATLPLLASLVSKSLVKRTEAGQYSLHEVIRQYALSHLKEDEPCCHQTCDRHCDYYLNFAANCESKLKSASQQTAVYEMTAELDNLRAAWDWGIKNKKFDSLGGAVRAFGWFYEVSGMTRDGVVQLESLARALNDSPRDPQTNKTLAYVLCNRACYISAEDNSPARRNCMTEASPASVTILAVFGICSSNFVTALLDDLCACISSQRPIETKTMSMVAVSKYKPPCPAIKLRTDKANAENVPMVMSVWMLGCPRKREAKPARRIGSPNKSKTGILVINIITWKKSTRG